MGLPLAIQLLGNNELIKQFRYCPLSLQSAFSMDISRQRSLLIFFTLAGIFPFVINGYINSKIFNIPLLYWGFELLSRIVFPVTIVCYLIKKTGLELSGIGMTGKLFGKKSYILLVTFSLLFCPLEFYSYKKFFYYFYTTFPSRPLFLYQSIIPDSGALKLFVVIYLAISSGFMEEIFYRGLTYKISNFFKHANYIYLAISPLLFSIVHWEGGLANLTATYILGVLLSIVFIFTKNLWPLIIGHIFTNFVWFLG